MIIYTHKSIANSDKGKEKLINKRKLTTWSCISYEPTLSNLLQDISHIHTSKDPDTLPIAKSILSLDLAGTASESTETGDLSTAITY